MTQKFLIIAEQRSGTNLITRLLKSHPDIDLLPEPFCHPYMYTGVNYTATPIEFVDSIFTNADGAGIHRSQRFKNINNNAEFWKYVLKNFKNSWNDDDVWKYLLTKDLKYVFIERKNHLKRYVSLQVAQQTRNWIDINDGTALNKLPRIIININDMFTDFERIENYTNKIKTLVKDSETLFLTYEGICNDIPKNTSEILAFIGYDDIKLEPETVKRETRPLSDAIINYNHVINAIRQSKWTNVLDW